jgi:hypothetical protein
MHYALLLPDTEERFVLKSSYDAAFVAAFKAAIPWDAREWDAANKLWHVDSAFAEVVMDLARAHGASVTDKRPSVAVSDQAPPALREACARLCITPDAPLAVAEAAYKALAKLHHPDVGGDTATMQAINDALTTFKAFNEVPFSCQ